MIAGAQLLQWHSPKVRVLDWPAFHLPFNNYIIIKDGREYSFRSFPEVIQTHHNPLVIAIAKHVGSRNFTVSQLKRHAKVVKGPLRDAIKGIDLGNELRKINGKRIDGYCIKSIGPAGQGVALWRCSSK
jgi:hypothetical protein